MIIYIYESDRARFVYDGCKYTVNILRHKWMVWVLEHDGFPSQSCLLARNAAFQGWFESDSASPKLVLCPMFNEYGIWDVHPSKLRGFTHLPYQTLKTRWWFQIFFTFTTLWGRFPIWLIFIRWVETTNQIKLGSQPFARFFGAIFPYAPCSLLLPWVLGCLSFQWTSQGIWSTITCLIVFYKIFRIICLYLAKLRKFLSEVFIIGKNSSGFDMGLTKSIYIHYIQF